VEGFKVDLDQENRKIIIEAHSSSNSTEYYSLSLEEAKKFSIQLLEKVIILHRSIVAQQRAEEERKTRENLSTSDLDGLRIFVVDSVTSADHVGG